MSEMSINTQICSCRKVRLKGSPAKWRTLYFGLECEVNSFTWQNDRLWLNKHYAEPWTWVMEKSEHRVAMKLAYINRAKSILLTIITTESSWWNIAPKPWSKHDFLFGYSSHVWNLCYIKSISSYRNFWMVIDIIKLSTAEYQDNGYLGWSQMLGFILLYATALYK